MIANENVHCCQLVTITGAEYINDGYMRVRKQEEQEIFTQDGFLLSSKI